MPSANALSVDIAMPQPCAVFACPALKARKMPIGTTMPPRPASTGRVSRRRSRSSPMSNSRRASRPMTRKKNVISPEFTQPCRSMARPVLPRCIDSRVAQNES